MKNTIAKVYSRGIGDTTIRYLKAVNRSPRYIGVIRLDKTLIVPIKGEL